MKKLTAVIFMLVAFVIMWFYFTPEQEPEPEPVETEEEMTYSKVIIPVASDVDTAQTDILQDYSETYTSFGGLSLNLGETLLHTYSATLQNDGNAGEDVEDQICAIKRNNNPNIILIVGLYDPSTALYTRAAEIETPVSKLNTFSLSIMDMTGDHHNEIIYTGFTDDRQTILQVYTCNIKHGEMSSRKVADIRSEGTISIQETSRSDAYALGISSGDSYNIIEYQPVQSNTGSSLDQLQITYVWDKNYKSYTRSASKLITSKVINSQEIDRILDGTRETFVRFLDGLWYKTTSTGDEARYIFMDTNNNEIICLVNENQETYSWTSDWMRRNGMTINTKNKSMSVLTRQLVVTLVASDEIKITANDNLLMVIGEETLWDGNYKKINSPQTLNRIQEQETPDPLIPQILTEDSSWFTTDGDEVVFTGTQWTELRNGEVTGGGIYAETEFKGTQLLQFRPTSGTPRISGYCRMQLEELQAGLQVLTLEPVTVTMSLIKQAGDRIRLERTVTPETDEEQENQEEQE